MSDQRDRGAATTALLTLVSVLLLAFGFLFLGKLVPAVGQNDALQTAADSAALAGAQEIGADMPKNFGQFVSHHFELPGCGTGAEAASSFAERNDASLVSYCYFPVSDEVRVTVRSKKVLADGRQGERSAVARVGFVFTGCSITMDPAPTPPPAPEPTATTSATSGSTPTPPPPPAPSTGQVRCLHARHGIDVTIDGAGAPQVFVDKDELLHNLGVKPRLVH